MPSVVNISTTQTMSLQILIHFQALSFLQDLLLKICLKNLELLKKENLLHLGSGFIIDEKGIVVTNNHVIQDAEDIIVRVNGDKEFKAKVIGADPLSDIAVLQLETKEKFIQLNLETLIKQELEIG